MAPNYCTRVGSVGCHVPRCVSYPPGLYVHITTDTFDPLIIACNASVILLMDFSLMVIFVFLAYTMFNVYLPKLLETRSSPGDGGAPKSLTESLWDVVIYSVGGCPGAIVSLTPILYTQLCPHVVRLQLGAYMVETRLGRRWSLASSTFVTALFCLMFVMVEKPWAVRASTVGIGLSATVRSSLSSLF